MATRCDVFIDCDGVGVAKMFRLTDGQPNFVLKKLKSICSRAVQNKDFWKLCEESPHYLVGFINSADRKFKFDNKTTNPSPDADYVYVIDTYRRKIQSYSMEDVYNEIDKLNWFEVTISENETEESPVTF